MRVWIGGTGTRYYSAMELPGPVSGLIAGSRTYANDYQYSPWGESLSGGESVPQPLRYMARELAARVLRLTNRDRSSR